MSAEPGAWLEVHAWATPGLEGLAIGDEAIVITWFHRARRSDRRNPLTGVFAIHGTPVVDIKPVLR